jgi:hypothetical protein
LFALGGRTWKLPEGGDTAALANDTVKGRPLLSLLKRGQRLIKSGPRLVPAEEGGGLMELSLTGAAGRAFPAAGAPGAGPLYMELRVHAEESEWLPLLGLPCHRLYRNGIYGIIDETALAEFAEPGGRRRYVLKGEDIPRFADSRGRLIFQFGDQKLKERLAEDSVFVNRERLLLILGALREQGRPGAGEAWAAPLLRYGERRFSVEEVSLRMNRDFILLEDQWVRREDLLAIGLFPLCSWAGGAAIEKIKLKPGELLRRGGGRFAGRFSGMEADTSLWLERGDKETIFHAHLDFLRAWGLSGGVTLRGHREQAAFLASAFARLASGGCKALALVERRYYELYLSPLLPKLKAVSLPGTGRESRGEPLRIVFYEDLPLSPAERRNAAGLLLLVEPEEALPQNETLAHLQSIRAEITLGIFSEAGELFRGPAAAKARNLFCVTEAELEPYLIRDAARPLGLPRFEFPLPRVFRPSDMQAGQNPFNCTAEEKFADLPGPSLYSELALFKTGGPPARFIPLRLLKGSLDTGRMDEDELAFFVYWRSEFRKGNITKTGEGYIRIYARELCLFTGGENDAETNFGELLRLWECYRAVFEGLDGFLPRWLVDFAALYGITDKAFPLLLPHAGDCNDSLLTDFYFHRHFIRENNSIAFADIILLIPKVIDESMFFEREPSSGMPRFPAESRVLAKDFENVLNAVDFYLREEFRLKLFEFFYPQVYDTEKREAFPAMERAGHSSYTIEGLRFTKNPHLTGFLENLFRYTEYCFRLKNGLEMKGRQPPLGDVWKSVAGSALGVAGEAPSSSKLTGLVLALRETGRVSAGGRQMKLLDSRIEKLRADSDAVRDLLKAEEEGQNNKPAVSAPAARGESSGGPEPRKRPLKAAKPPVKDRAKAPDKAPISNPGTRLAAGELKDGVSNPPARMKGFLKGLDKTGLETLRIIAGAGGSGLEDFARKSGTMPELLIDRINAAFLEQFDDLLIDTVDEKPAIQSEYREILKNLLGTAAGN